MRSGAEIPIRGGVDSTPDSGYSGMDGRNSVCEEVPTWTVAAATEVKAVEPGGNARFSFPVPGEAVRNIERGPLYLEG